MPQMALQRRMDKSAGAPAPPEPAAFTPAAYLLSDREHQIALLVTRGFSNKEIAIELSISPWTVSAHLRSVFNKLDIGRRIELCALMRAG
jgi:DNA-binding CsgD family transcriptional regulator